MFLSHLVNAFGHVGHQSLIGEYFLWRLALHQVVNLHDGDVVGFAEEESDGVEHAVVGAFHLWVAANGVGNEQGTFQLVGLVGAKWHAL